MRCCRRARLQISLLLCLAVLALLSTVQDKLLELQQPLLLMPVSVPACVPGARERPLLTEHWGRLGVAQPPPPPSSPTPSQGSTFYVML